MQGFTVHAAQARPRISTRPLATAAGQQVRSCSSSGAHSRAGSAPPPARRRRCRKALPLTGRTPACLRPGAHSTPSPALSTQPQGQGTQQQQGQQQQQQQGQQQLQQRRPQPAMRAVTSSGGRAGVEAATPAPPAPPATAPTTTAPPAAAATATAPARQSIAPASLRVEAGAAAPLGASPGPAGGPAGVNFALWAPAATSVTLCLSDWEDQPLLEAPMTRTGDTWHAFVAGLPQARVLYGYRVDGKGGWETPYRWDKNKVGAAGREGGCTGNSGAAGAAAGAGSGREVVPAAAGPALVALPFLLRRLHAHGTRHHIRPAFNPATKRRSCWTPTPSTCGAAPPLASATPRSSSSPRCWGACSVLGLQLEQGAEEGRQPPAASRARGGGQGGQDARAVHRGAGAARPPAVPPCRPAPLQEGSVFRGTFDFEAQPFDWGRGYRRPNIPLKDLVIAELPVRLFTGAPAAGVGRRRQRGWRYATTATPTARLPVPVPSRMGWAGMRPALRARARLHARPPPNRMSPCSAQPRRPAGCRRGSAARSRGWPPRWTTSRSWG